MGKPLNLVGNKYGRLSVVEYVSLSPSRKSVWRCVCDCGNTVECVGSNLISGNTESCGCFKRDRIKETKTLHGSNGTNPTYGTWYSMRQRCNNKNSHKWPIYGALGVTVCERWSVFTAFLEDMGERPEGKTLDRINTFGNYEKDNCRWATAKEQRNNQRNQHKETA